MDLGVIFFNLICILNIDILDENDNIFFFFKLILFVDVLENMRIGEFVFFVIVIDLDFGDNVDLYYSIIGINNYGIFSISLNIGSIFFVKKLDFEI